MKKLFLVIVAVFIILPSLQAQSNVNSYKYVIVPLQYKFLKGQNKYRLNTLTKQLFLKSGYEVYYDNQLLPDDVFQDRCLAMYVDVNEVEKAAEHIDTTEIVCSIRVTSEEWNHR